MLVLPSSLPTAAFCIDGQIVSVGLRCDKLVLIDYGCESPNWCQVFVEIKGKDVMYAVKQLRETIKNPVFHHSSNRKRKYARIVGKSYPSNNSNPVLEKAKKEFEQRYSCELKTLKPDQTDAIAID